MRSTPSLENFNRFSVLDVDDDYNELSMPPIEVVPPPPPLSDYLPPRTPWERKRLPKAFVRSAEVAPLPNSLDLDVELRTTDTGVDFRTRALVDSGATGSFIDRD